MSLDSFPATDYQISTSKMGNAPYKGGDTIELSGP